VRCAAKPIGDSGISVIIADSVEIVVGVVKSMLLRDLIEDIEKTHKGLGRFVVMNLICARSRRCLLNVAPAGCGKSIASMAAAEAEGSPLLKFFKLSIAGFHRVKDDLTNFNGTIWVDDLAAAGTGYMRTATVTAIATLSHEHFYRSATSDQAVVIDNFQGGALMNIQPILMQSIIQSDDWEAIIRDKCIRYYHFIRPKKPKKRGPVIPTFKPASSLEVVPPKMTGPLWWGLIMQGLAQWSYARAIEHISAMLRGIASLEGRKRVMRKDYELLGDLMRNVAVEPHLIERTGLEYGRVFHVNGYNVLVELISFRDVTLKQLAVDYHMSLQNAYNVMNTVTDWVMLSDNSPKRLIPTERAKIVMEMVR
jgi:hypothetical protein